MIVNILDSESVPLRPTTVQVSNLALTWHETDVIRFFIQKVEVLLLVRWTIHCVIMEIFMATSMLGEKYHI